MEKEIKKSEQRILHLTLKKKWYDMISSGEKKEEYREIKPYWEQRLELPRLAPFVTRLKEFDFVVFKNGYSKDAPSMKVECKGIKLDYSKAKWCDGVEDFCYVIKLGKVIWNNKLM